MLIVSGCVAIVLPTVMVDIYEILHNFEPQLFDIQYLPWTTWERVHHLHECTKDKKGCLWIDELNPSRFVSLADAVHSLFVLVAINTLSRQPSEANRRYT